jgi:hypothetical protein
MSLFTEYNSLLKLYREYRKLGRARDCEPNAAPSQVRIDVCSTGFCVCPVRNKVMGKIEYRESDNYENAMNGVAAFLIESRLLKPGMALVASLWPPTLRVQQVPVGPGKTHNDVNLLDSKVMAAPESVSLDAGSLFRAIPGKPGDNPNADVIGIPSTGLKRLSEAVPPGVAVGRYWGGLVALDVIFENYGDHLPEQVLVGICDSQKVYYFALRRGILSGVRSGVPRSALREITDLRGTMNTAAIDPPAACLVSLTINSHDVEKLGEQIEKHEHPFPVDIATRAGLLTHFSALEPLGAAAQLPITLFQGGVHP